MFANISFLMQASLDDGDDDDDSYDDADADDDDDGEDVDQFITLNVCRAQ